MATIEVKVFDNNHIQCLDAANWVRFGLTGDGALDDDLGTSGGSRLVQLYNGRATISMHTKGGVSVISAKVETLPVVFLNIK
jgi:beta-galactosidase